MLNNGLFNDLISYFVQEIVTPTEDLESRWPGRSCRCQNNKLKSCRFVEIKNGLSLSQIVAFFL